jgi:hypothetical protein
VLDFLTRGKVKLGLDLLRPSGVDRAAAALTREMLIRRRVEGVAFALPRGQHPLPLFLGLYMALGRLHGENGRSFLPLLGSVAVFSTDMRLRELAPKLRAEGGAIVDVVDVRRLRADGGWGTLKGTGEHGPLDHTQHFVLLALPWLRPELPVSAVKAAVIDATSTRRENWEISFEWHSGERRRQVWFGELGDRDFEEFCERRQLPLVRFDWATVRFCAEHFGPGSGPLATTALCERALGSAGTPVRLGMRPVCDGDLNRELHRLEQCFADWHRRADKLMAKGIDEPGVVRTARQLTYLLGRLACPLASYDAIALDTPRVMHAATALRQVRTATDQHFFGPWRKLNGDWAAIRGALTALYEQVAGEEPKWYDLVFLLDEEAARQPTRPVVIRCATRAEAQALGGALLADRAVDADAFESGWLSVRYFGVRDRPLEHGPDDDSVLTVVTDPPPPFRSGPYLTGEVGELQALLYPCQAARFERLAVRATERGDGSRRNLDALRAIGLDCDGDDAPAQAPPHFIHLPALVTGRRDVAPGETDFGESVERMRDHWEEYLGLTSENGDQDAASGNTADAASAAAGGRQVPAVVVHLDHEEAVLLPADATVDTLLRDRVISRPVRSLPGGALVVLMVGSERGSAMSELFEAWDAAYGPAQVYGSLYQQAVHAAINREGSPAALALALGVTEQTICNWRDGDVIGPDSDAHLSAVLGRSGIDAAVANQAHIRRYIKRVRGAHINLGKAFSRAVVDHFVDPNNAARARLEADTGRDLSELFESVRVRTVQRVDAQPHPVAAGLLGRPLPATHPAVTRRTT